MSAAETAASHDAAQHASGGFDAGALIMDNILDHVWYPIPKVFGIDMSITKVVVMLWLAAAILIILGWLASRSIKEPVPRGFRSVMETLVLFVRDEIARKSIGHGADFFVPYLLTAFFFILVCNLLGLVPGMKSPTAIISVTATLAIMTFVMTQVAGIRNYGVVKHFQNLLPHGLPKWLLPIMIPVELLGLFSKPFALAVRLFANMTAGTVIIVSLISLIFILETSLVATAAVPFAVFIYMLKILVGFIQAFIFTLLSALFIGMAAHPAH